MKRIDTLIHAAHWEAASALFASLNVPVTLREVKTFGRSPPRRGVYRGTAYHSNVTPELEITAVVSEAQLEQILGALQPLAQGDEIFVSTVEGPPARAEKSSPRAVPAPAAALPRAPALALRVALARA